MPGTPVTNVTEDPRWITATYLNSHDPGRRAMGEALLNDLYHRRQLQESALGRQEQIGAHMSGLREQIRDREERARLTREEGARRDRETQGYRADVLAAREQAQKSEDDARMLAMLPEIQQTFGKQGAAITKQMLTDYLTRHGVNTGVTAPPTEADQAILRTGQAMGKTPVQPAGQGAGAIVQPQAQTTSAPAAAPQGFGAGLTAPADQRQLTGTRWMAGTGGVSGGNNATLTRFYDDGTSETVPGGPAGEAAPTLPPVQRNVEGGNVVGPMAKSIPEGYDFNFNTGRLVPKTQEGTINGVPQSQALARGALTSGVNPIHSAGAMDILDRIRGQAADVAPYAGKPTVETNPEGFVKTGAEGVPVPAIHGEMKPTMAPSSLAQQPVAGQPQPAPTAQEGGAGGYEMFKHNPIDVLRSIGQGLVPSVFGYPPNTPGAPKPPIPPEEVEKKKLQEQPPA